MDPQSPRGSDMAVVLVSGFCDLLRRVSVNDAVHRNGFGVELLGDPGDFDVVLKSNMGLLTHLHNATWRKTHKNFRGALDALNKSMNYTLSPTDSHSNWTLHQAEHLLEFWRTVARKVRRPGNSSNGLINDLRTIFNVSVLDVDTDEDCEDEDTQMVPWPGSPASPGACSVVNIPDSQSVADDDHAADQEISVPTFINAVVADCVRDAETATIDHENHKKQRLLLKKPAAAPIQKRPAGAPPEDADPMVMRRPAGAPPEDADPIVMRRPAGVSSGPDPVTRSPAPMKKQRCHGAAAVNGAASPTPGAEDVIARMKELLLDDEGNRDEPRATPTISRKEERGNTLFQIRAGDFIVGQATVLYFGTEERARDVAQGMAEMWEQGYSKESINAAKTSMRK